MEAKELKASPPYRMTVEPLMFSVLFITTCTSGVTIDVIERNLYCQSAVDCGEWGKQRSLMSQELNSKAAQINMMIRLVQAACPLLISMFVGPWTDTNGRKPFMMLTLAGYFWYNILWAVMAFFPRLNPNLFLIPSIPLSLSGGQLALYLCCYCYISDITDVASRTVRFSIMSSSSLLGSLAGSCFVILMDKMPITKDQCYIFVFSTCAFVAFLALMYARTYLSETIQLNPEKGMDFIFNIEFAKSVATCLFSKPLREIIITILTVFMLFFDIVIKKGEKVTLYLVGLDQFSWSLSYYNLFSAWIILLSAISSSAISMLLKKYLGWQNLTIILLASVTVFSSEVLRSISRNELDFWLTSSFNTLTTLTAPAVSAQISMLASKEDMGKVYAFNALVDSLVPFVAISLYSEVYRSLIPSGRVLNVYLVSAASALTIGVSAGILMMMKSKDRFNSLRGPQSANKNSNIIKNYV